MAGLSASQAIRETLAWFRWEVARGLRLWHRLAGPAGTATLVALAAAAMAWVWLEASHRSNQALALSIEALRASPRPEASSTAAVVEPRATFRQRLKPAGAAPETVRSLIRLAEREGLILPKGEYKMEPDAAGGFVRVRMVLPVQGEAAAVQRFVLAALQSEPALAIESIQFRKERLTTPETDARVHWVLFTEEPAEGLRPIQRSSP